MAAMWAGKYVMAALNPPHTTEIDTFEVVCDNAAAYQRCTPSSGEIPNLLGVKADQSFIGDGLTSLYVSKQQLL